MAKCKLCLLDKQLIGKSHIIPDFMYEGLYDAKHKLHLFNPHEMLKSKGYVKNPSSGEYEGGLLCKECENDILNHRYEDYAKRALYSGELPIEDCITCNNYKNQNGVEFTLCKNINYQKFKLFLLSILWRASISSRPMFTEVSLGPHEEIIRKMIYEENAGEIEEYPIFLMTYLNDLSTHKDLKNLITHPRKIRTKERHIVYIFMIGGMIYTFYVNSVDHKLPSDILNQKLISKDEMHIYHIPIGQGLNTVLGYYGIK